MIWVGGRVVPDDELKISVLDRTFEHGLGLFETLRTYNRRAVLLGRHMKRLANSARELELPLDPAQLPDGDAVTALLDAEGRETDVMLRVTLSGGLDATRGSTLWMRSAPLPPPLRPGGAIIDLGSWWVSSQDTLTRYKSFNYWDRRRAYERARLMGFDEVLNTLGTRDVGFVWEGSRTNLFVITGDRLVTPGLNGHLVPGIFRALVLERAVTVSLDVLEIPQFPIDALARADEVFLTNSVRGIIPVARVVGASPDETWQWRAPGAWTKRLSILINDWLAAGGNPT